MAIDMVALKAKLAALKTQTAVTTVIPTPTKENQNETNSVVLDDTGNTSSGPSSASSVPVDIRLTNTDVIGTAKTSEIDHLDFLAKMNSLQEAIHKQHPTMPVLLMQIHKQLRADPELTSTLSEEGIGVIVKGLQLQTKTELVSVVLKESKSKKKKEPISLDMF